jgi:putative ABC transport system permease protein
LALGAKRADILFLIVRQGLILATAGIGIGIAAALVMTKMMSSLLYKIGTRDLKTFASTSIVFLAIAVFASYLPARRATKIDPAEALRGS